MLVDVSRVDTSTTLLGGPTAAPIMIAPTGQHGAVCPDGEAATAAAAASTFGEDYWAECDAEDALHREREDEDRQREERRRAGR